MPQLDLDDLAEKATAQVYVRWAARRLTAIFAILGIALLRVDTRWMDSAALVIACLAAVMGWIVYPRLIRGAKTEGPLDR